MIHTFQLAGISVAASVSILIVLTIMDLTYKGPLFEFTISDDGIPNWQGKASAGSERIYATVSKFGGGTELTILCLVSLIWLPREKFFYYLTVFTLDKFYIGYFKLAFADPRPYMVNGKITPFTCEKAFGNPSGHSSASQAFGFVLLLDIFHGKSYKKGRDGTHEVYFYSWAQYIFMFAFAVLWATFIPYCRWMLGVHSLDQIVFGITLGWWTVFTSHFIVRDHIIYHVSRIRQWHHDIKLMHDSGDGDTQASEQPALTFNAKFYALLALGMFMLFELISIVTFVIIDNRLRPDSEQVITWKKNFKQGCHKELEMTYSLQNGSINGCGYMAVFTASYIAYIYRMQTIPVCEGPIHETSTMKGVLIGLHRLVLIVLSCGLLAIPTVLLKVNQVGSAIIILFTNVLIPLSVACIMVQAGPVDYIIAYVEDKLGIESTRTSQQPEVQYQELQKNA